MVTVVRGEERVDLDEPVFWKLAEARQLQPTDWVSCTDGQFRQAQQIWELKTYLPEPVPVQSPSPQPTQQGEDFFDVLGKLVLGAVAIAGAVYVACKIGQVLDDALGPKQRRIVYNDEPLTEAKRQQIRERDQETCQYCGVHAPHGHVDHERSRADGGTNRSDNLVWACITCNTSKGNDNAAQFRRRMGL
ncbi:hypothetical protein ANRL1_03827 [Anaerolineae bacterium]|nr:hypothetical protein ANRL1_03827 [Anaerolineae bacterium]